MSSVLTIGSVVMLKNKKNKYIIFGKKIFNKEKEYDYIGYVYPYGFTKDQEYVFFNDEDIEYLCQLGNINYK